MEWKVLDTLSQLEHIHSESKTNQVAIFKHSTRCGISAMVKRQFETEYDSLTPNTPVYYLDLLQHRDISNEIAQRYEVAHQSPQLLVIKDGACIHHASHHLIEASDL